MTIRPIRNDDDLKKAFRRLEKVFQAAEGTAQADERDVLVALVEAYENKHYDFGTADPVEAIKFRMEQDGLTPRDLEPFIGPSGRVSEVLNRKRPLSLRMVKRLHDGLKIPYESLLAEAQWLQRWSDRLRARWQRPRAGRCPARPRSRPRRASAPRRRPAGRPPPDNCAARARGLGAADGPAPATRPRHRPPSCCVLRGPPP